MNWPVKQLGDVCHTTSGGTPSRTRADYFGGSIPWIKSGDLTDGYIDSCEEKITETGLRNSSAKMFSKGTVLLAMYGATVGKLGMLSIEAATNQAVCGITPPEDIDRFFLFYFLLSQRQDLINKSTGGAQPNISQKIVRELLLPVPPLEEQCRIVDLLSRAEGIVRLRREAQRKAAEVIPALFNDAFGDLATNPKQWEVVSLGDLLERVDYGSSTKASEDAAGLPLIRMGNVNYAGDFDLSDLKYVELSPENVARFRIEKGDILFNRTNSKELVGKTGLWESDMEAIAASYFIRLRVIETMARPFFVWAFMNTPYMKRVIFETARGAIGQANINSRELKAFRVPLPSLETQKLFEARVRDVLALRSLQGAASCRAEGTFNALLARTFSATTLQSQSARSRDSAVA